MFDIKRNYDGSININNLRVNIEPIFGRGKYSFIYNGETYYFKNCNNKDEGYRELIAEEFATMYGIEHAEYDLGCFNGSLGALSKSIAKKDEEFVDFFMLFCTELPDCKWPETFNNLEDMKNIIMPTYCGENAESEFRKYVDLFLFDVTIGNHDRNASNQGFIKKNGIYTYAPAFDNADMVSNFAVLEHHFSQGVDRSDTELVPRDKIRMKKDLIIKLIEESPYGERLKDSLMYLTDERILEAFNRVEMKINAPIAFDTKRDLFNKLTNYRDSVLEMLSGYYDGVVIRKRV